MIRFSGGNLNFSDVYIKPQFSTVMHRYDVDLSTTIARNPRTQEEFHYKYPIICANMESLVGPLMLETMHDLGCPAIMHRYMKHSEALDMINMFRSHHIEVIPCIGSQEEDFQKAQDYFDLGCRLVCLDVAHGDHIMVTRLVNTLSEEIPELAVIAGNIATYTGAMNLYGAGAAGLKVGISNGSVCLTKDQSGACVPQFSAVEDCANLNDSIENSIPVISDGGCKVPGDFVKALAAGASAVMSGYMFAGCPESQMAQAYDKTGKMVYRGMASQGAKQDFFGEAKYIEGKETDIYFHHKSAKEIVQTIVEGIQSGCSYSGAHNIKELQEKTEFVLLK